MKKIYLICLLFCLSIVANAQTTVTIFADGPAGSYTTGSAIQVLPAGTITRNDGIIAVSDQINPGQKQRGYAVFDLNNQVPIGATISSVVLGVRVSGTTFPSGPSGYAPCVTYGRVGDLSAVTTPATLFADCITPVPSTAVLFNATTATAQGSYGTGAVGDVTMTAIGPSSIAALFIGTVAAQPSQKFSICYTGGGANVYNFLGETSNPATIGQHVPYVQITYCFKPQNPMAVINPSSICAGQTFSLTGSATGATSYTWVGPSGSGFFSNVPVTTAIANLSSTGTYTFTAYTSCGAFLDSNKAYASLTVSASPAPLVTPTLTVCTGATPANFIVLSDITPGGNWSSSVTSVATVSNTTPKGVVTAGAVAGTTIISYTLASCSAVATVTVNAPPTPITGRAEVCASGGITTLSDGVTGGTWSSSNSSAATVDPITGIVTGTTAGPVTIRYVTQACPTVGYAVVVDPLPLTIQGPVVVCVNANISLSDQTPNGTWSGSNSAIGLVSQVGGAGIVTGVAAGTMVVTYMLPTTCFVTMSVTVNPIPAVITGPSAVCVQQVIALSDATAGGAWSMTPTANGTITAGGVVTGVSAGTPLASYTLPLTGCFVTHSVTVNPLPSPITGLDKVCSLATITLSDASPNGTWSSQLTSVATVDMNSGVVTGAAAGVTHVTYTLAATTCYTSFSVTVNPLPTSVITPAGPATFCTGGSVVLNATTGGGLTYQWYSNGGPLPAQTTSSYTSNSTELVTVEITDANGCIKMSDGIQVSLIPSVTIQAGGATVFCHTGNVVLSVPLAPNILYQWKLNGVNISGATQHTYAATEDGVYTADLIVPGGCASTTPPFTVVVHPTPNPTIFYSGTQLVTTTGFLTYQWFLNSVAIAGATTNAVTPTVNGSYRVRVTDGNGCTGYAVAFIVSNLSVTSVNATDISIYPNPASNTVHITSPITLRATISAMDGKTLLDQDNATDVDITALPPGVYMMSLYDINGNRAKVEKLVKE